MKVLSEVMFSVKVLKEVPEDINKKWQETTILNAERMNNRRKAAIKNMGDYQNRISEISNQKYEPYINPAFVSKKGLKKSEIMAKHYKNCAEGYQKYTDKLDYVYETVDGIPAKRYKERVQRNAAHYGANVAKKVLAFTGTKVGGLGPAAMAARWLDGDNTLKKGEAFEIVKGDTVIIADPDLRAPFKAALEPTLVSAGAKIVRGDLTPQVIRDQNDIINKLMNALANPALNLEPFATGGASHVDYVVNDAGVFLLHIKVSSRT